LQQQLEAQSETIAILVDKVAAQLRGIKLNGEYERE
jgi:hypothetical protein